MGRYRYVTRCPYRAKENGGVLTNARESIWRGRQHRPAGLGRVCTAGGMFCACSGLWEDVSAQRHNTCWTPPGMNTQLPHTPLCEGDKGRSPGRCKWLQWRGLLKQERRLGIWQGTAGNNIQLSLLALPPCAVPRCRGPCACLGSFAACLHATAAMWRRRSWLGTPCLDTVRLVWDTVRLCEGALLKQAQAKKEAAAQRRV